MDQIISYILGSSLLPKIILNILFVIMLSGIIKMFFKLTKLKDLHNIRRLILSILTIIIGGFAGLAIFSFSFIIDFMIGSCCGYFSSIIYRIVIKKIYNKFNINISDEE